MLSKRLEELSRDPSNPDSIVELAVTALGPQGSFYICWKTRSGQYQQGMRNQACHLPMNTHLIIVSPIPQIAMGCHQNFKNGSSRQTIAEGISDHYK